MDWIISYDKEVGSKQANSLPFSWLPSLSHKILAVAPSFTFSHDRIQSRRVWSFAFAQRGKIFPESFFLTTHWAELGNMVPPKPRTGKGQDYHSCFRTIMIHSQELSTLSSNIWTLSGFRITIVSATASFCPLLSQDLPGEAVQDLKCISAQITNCPSDSCLPQGIIVWWGGVAEGDKALF